MLYDNIIHDAGLGRLAGDERLRETGELAIRLNIIISTIIIIRLMIFIIVSSSSSSSSCNYVFIIMFAIVVSVLFVLQKSPQIPPGICGIM